jgi:hypothetical protein
VSYGQQEVVVAPLSVHGPGWFYANREPMIRDL